MCYFLYAASPLTLSEIRSMLPDGFSAELVEPDEARLLKGVLRKAQTVVRLLSGGCSCDLVRQRHPEQQEDERALRLRFRKLGYSRDRVIGALEQHRRSRELDFAPGAAALAEFVWEHARNAGPTLYYLHFSQDGLIRRPPPSRAVVTHSAEAVKQKPGEWLVEDQFTMVVR